MTPEAFYLPLGDDVFETTSATESPWDQRLQHGGPPAALLARAIERTRPDDDTMPIARITVDMLGGIPQGRIRTEAQIVRPGRRIELVQARMFAGDRLAVTATAWRITQLPGSTAHLTRTETLPPIPGQETEWTFPGVPESWGYRRAIDWRFVSGGAHIPGPAAVWTRLRIPLVAGEEPSGVQRLCVVADSTNGISGEVPITEWLFIPPALSVTIQRPPQSDWMLLDAHSSTGPDGVGLAQGRMSDEHGFCAATAQPLLVTRRG